MDATWMIDRLDRFPRSLAVLLEGVSDPDARWRPGDEHWSLVEIVSHLVDEDLDDFGTRLRLTIESPDEDWPLIDPVAAATERHYRDRSLATMLHEFAAVRRTKIGWLRTVVDADWSTTATHPRLQHPTFGGMSAGDLLAAWCAHDALHLRQIAKRLHQLTDHHSGPHAVGYAGDW